MGYISLSDIFRQNMWWKIGQWAYDNYWEYNSRTGIMKTIISEQL